MENKTCILINQLIEILEKKPEMYANIIQNGVLREVVECVEEELELRVVCEDQKQLITEISEKLLQDGSTCSECIQILQETENRLNTLEQHVLSEEDYNCRYVTEKDDKALYFEYLLPVFWWSRFYEYGWAGKFCGKDDVVLDAACGIPHPLKFYLADKCKKVYACDMDEKIVSKEAVFEEIQELPDVTEKEISALSRKYDQIEFSKQDLTHLNYENQMFDTVFCISVVEHMDVESQTNTLKEFYRVLRNGGKIVLTMDIPSVNLNEFLVTARWTGFQFMGKVSMECPEDAIYSEKYGINCFRIVMRKETVQEEKARQEFLSDIIRFCEEAKMLRNSSNCYRFYRGKYSENECDQAMFYLARTRMMGAYVFGTTQDLQPYMQRYILEKFPEITSESRIMEVGPGNLPLFDEEQFINWCRCDLNYDAQEDEILFAGKVWGKNKYDKVYQGSWEDVDQVCEKNNLGSQFDLVCGSHSFEHCTKPITALTNAAKILKTGGKIVLFVPDGYSNWGGNYDCTHYIYMVEDMALEFFHYAGGFKNVECRQFRRNMDLVITAEKI